MLNVALYKPKSILDRLVCFFSRGKYSHAALVFEDDMVIESRPFKGVIKSKNLIKASESKSVIDLYSIRVSKKKYEVIREFMLNKVGSKYDYMSVFGFVLFSNKQNRHSRNKWFCGEIIISAFNKVHIYLVGKMPAWKASPTTLSYSPKLKFTQTVNIP